MMKIYVVLIVVLIALSGMHARADCADRVANTQAEVEALFSETGDATLDRVQSTRLTIALLNLCDERELGQSQTETQNKNVYTTQELNPKQQNEDADEEVGTTLFGLKVKPKGSDARFKRPGKK